MTPFTTLTGIAAPMPPVSIDIDMIIPRGWHLPSPAMAAAVTGRLVDLGERP